MKHIRKIAFLLASMLLLGACSPVSPEITPDQDESTATGEDRYLSVTPGDATHSVAGPITWYSADLKETMHLAAEYVEGMLDADKDYEPYFFISAGGYGSPAYALHALEIGIPHVTGRAIDCLFNVERATGRKIDSFAEETYTKYYYSCMEEIGLPVWYDESTNRQGMESHNLRESCEALAWLIRSRGDDRASALADRFLTVLETIMPDHCGYIKSRAVADAGLSDWFSGDRNAPGDTGRLVGALLNLYDASGDERAFTLAGDIAQNADNWFNPKTGSMANAGTHIHSITSTLSGLLEYGYMTDDHELVNLVRAVYEGEKGLQQVMSSTGWIKEQINVANEVQGEVNQIGDVIEIQLLFAKNEVSERANWYGEAESFMRSALLPSQVLDNSFFTTKDDPSAGDAYANIAERAIGGFGFPMPTAHLQARSSPINTIDITQGAVQAISYFTNHIAYLEDDILWVNLLFDWENEVAAIESSLPLQGQVQITPRQDCSVYIRAWDNVSENGIHVNVNGKEAAFTVKDGYILLTNIKSGDAVSVDFDIESRNYTETFYKGTPQECEYTIYQYGEQVVAVTPIKGVYPLYANWPLEIEGLDLSEQNAGMLTDEMKERGYLALVPLDDYSPDVLAQGAANAYVVDEERGRCLSYTQPNATSAEHGILVDMYFEPAILDASTDAMALWLYVDDPMETTPLIIEYASAAMHAGEEMFQGVIDLPAYAANGSLKAGWNPIVVPLDLADMDFHVQINADNSPNLDNIFRIRLMNTQSGTGRAVNYKLDHIAFVRGDALLDYRYEDGSTALKDSKAAQPSKGEDYLLYMPLDASAKGIAVGGASPEFVSDSERGSCLSFTAANTTEDLFVLADLSFDAVSLSSDTDSLAFWLYIEDISNVDTLIVEYSSFRLNAGEEMSQYMLDLEAAVAEGRLHKGWNPIVMPLNMQEFEIPCTVLAETGTQMDQVIRIRLMNGQNGSGSAQIYRFDDVAFIRGSALKDYSE
ncbi:MAG: hypothetical protein IJA85_09980 [Clostridia bacterium]|nr:hypothetical protein [Clostridia bacterium]